MKCYMSDKHEPRGKDCLVIGFGLWEPGVVGSIHSKTCPSLTHSGISVPGPVVPTLPP